MRRKALWMAFATTLLWSGSYILNKLAFQGGVGPLTLSGMRYLLAGAILLLLQAGKGRGRARESGARLPLPMTLALGLLGYAVAQGLQYAGQKFLTPTQSSLCLSVGNTALVMAVDRLWLRENQSRLDWLKLLLMLTGITLYYSPFGDVGFSSVGILLMALSSVGYALHMTLNRRLLVKHRYPASELVARPMIVGAALLLAVGLCVEGLPAVTLNLLLILMYLSAVSGALGFTLWTRSQKELTAFESSGINNLMLIEIALMDFLFFGRAFTVWQIAAIALVFGSVVWIQVGRGGNRAPKEPARKDISRH